MVSLSEMLVRLAKRRAVTDYYEKNNSRQTILFISKEDYDNRELNFKASKSIKDLFARKRKKVCVSFVGYDAFLFQKVCVAKNDKGVIGYFSFIGNQWIYDRCLLLYHNRSKNSTLK